MKKYHFATIFAPKANIFIHIFALLNPIFLISQNNCYKLKKINKIPSRLEILQNYILFRLLA